MHSKDKNWIIKQDKLNNSDTLNKLYQTKKIKKDEEKNSSANEKKNYNPKLLINIKDYVKLLNSIESLKKKLQNELEKFDAGLTKINYMNKNYDNYNKIKKDLKKIQTNSNSELDSMNKTNLYFSNFCIEKKSNKEFKSDSESSNNSSFDYLKDKFDKRRSDCHRIECKTSRDNYMSYNYEERGILMDIYKPTNHKSIYNKSGTFPKIFDRLLIKTESSKLINNRNTKNVISFNALMNINKSKFIKIPNTKTRSEKYLDINSSKSY